MPEYRSGNTTTGRLAHRALCLYRAQRYTSRLQQQIEAISQLPRTQQRFVSKILETVLAQASRSLERMMMTKIQIELPDATAQAAQAAGLLTPKMLDHLLSNALRRQQAGNYLLAIADEVATAGIPPMTMEEINAEVKAARKERQQRADRH